MNYKFIAVFLALLLIPVYDVYGLGLIWEGVSKSGSKLTDLGDVGGCDVDGLPLKYQSSNGTWICGTDLTGNGLTSANTVSNNATIIQNNGTTSFTLKNIGDGNYITWFNNTSNLIANLLPIPTSFITNLDTQLSSFFNNIAETNTGNTTSIIGSNSSQRLALKTFSPGTGIILTNDANNIVITSSVTDTGFTNLASTNTVNATLVAYNATNPITKAVFKTISCGAGCYVTNGTDNLVIVNTVVDTDTTNISQISTTNSTIIADNSTSTNNVRLKGIAGGTGIAVHNGTNTITIFNTGALTDTDTTNITSLPSNATLVHDNSTNSNKVIFKNISAGSGIQIDNGTNSIIIKNTGALIDTGFTTIASEVATANNATLIVENSTNRAVIKTLSQGLGITLINNTNSVQINVTNGVNTLSGNLTSSLAGSNYQQIWRIPLTPNTGSLVDGMIIARSLSANVAPQFTANVTDNNITGYCTFRNPLTVSTEAIDNLILNNTGTLVVMTDTAETTTFPNTGINGTLIDFECGMIVGNVQGDLRLFFQSEVEGSAVEIKTGSYYKRTP